MAIAVRSEGKTRERGARVVSFTRVMFLSPG
jgi:hypothetical protein